MAGRFGAPDSSSHTFGSAPTMPEKSPFVNVDEVKPAYGWSTLLSHQPTSVRSFMSHGSWNTVVAKSFAEATVPGAFRVTVIWADTGPAAPASTRAHSNSVRFMVPREGSSFRKTTGELLGAEGPGRKARAPSSVLGTSSIADGESRRQRGGCRRSKTGFPLRRTPPVGGADSGRC